MSDIHKKFSEMNNKSLPLKWYKLNRKSIKGGIMMKHHPLITTLLNLEGNPRICTYTEPLWGIPYNLFAPYASIYMYSMGVSDSQLGLIASIGMIFQIIFSLLGGVITDKLGRRRTTLIFDTIGWSIPCLIWAISRSFPYFVIATIINSVSRVTMNSWSCLLVEDCDRKQIISIYTWISIFGLGAAFFAPISGIFISKYELIPTMRVVYLIAFFMMTSKFVILYKYSIETKHGKIRRLETKNLSILSLLNGYIPVIKQILKTRETLLTLGIMIVMSIFNMVNGTFWSIIAIEKIHIQTSNIGIFSFIRSLVMFVFFFTIVPKINTLKFIKPLVFGFSSLILSQLLLVVAPDKGYLVLGFSILFEAFSLSMINPLLDSLQVVMVDPKERARIIAILYVIVITLTSPFGYIAGILSGINHILPFVMNIVFLFLGLILTYFASKVSSEKLKTT